MIEINAGFNKKIPAHRNTPLKACMSRLRRNSPMPASPTNNDVDGGLEGHIDDHCLDIFSTSSAHLPFHGGHYWSLKVTQVSS